MVHLGNWMLNSNRIQQENIFDELASSLYAPLRKRGKKGRKRAGLNGSAHSEKLQELCHKIIARYENDVFWDELIHRLVERDLNTRSGKSAANGASLEQLFRERCKMLDFYAAEFERHGLRRVMLKRRRPA